jgi:cytoskeletal protein RodZ
MNSFDRYTRVDKFEKRRKNTKLISILIIVASFLAVFLIGIWIFGPDKEPKEEIASPETSIDKNTTENDAENIDNSEDSSQTEGDSSDSNEGENESDGSDDSFGTENTEKQPANPIDQSENVIDAYTANWSPIGTEQTGPHTTKFELESQDWVEMEKAIRLATGLQEGDMVTWFIGNGGEQKAIGTVTNKAETEIYRVYLSWVDNQGWQPILVERLKENDKK